MCGITGFWTHDPALLRDAEARLDHMLEPLIPRGPDAFGRFVDEAAGIALGHRRLSIIDLSDDGKQPMWSGDGRLGITFNGEVYNYRALRAELEARGRRFKSGSDTEVMLEAIDAFGLEAALDRFVGMFAFALWDREDRALTLVRDRLGIKPLYYAVSPRGLAFGSTLAPVERFGGLDGEVDVDVLAAYLRRNCVPGERAILRGAKKVPPGGLVRFSAPDAPRPSIWWSATEVALRARRQGFDGDPTEAVDAVEGALSTAVRDRLVADVPLGAFLSGGIDSSTVVALMQEVGDGRAKTFSIGFTEAAYDESSHAREIAGALGTDHTELIVTPEEAWSVIPRLPAMWDEPFADSSQVPTYLVSELARRHVTVSLSGDGGDELFGGYNRHVWAPRIWRRLRRVPGPLRRTAAARLDGIPWGPLGEVVDRTTKLLPARAQVRMPTEKLQKALSVLDAGSEGDLYQTLTSHWPDAERLVGARGAAHQPPLPGAGELAFAERLMLADTVGYLPDDILTKVDRASMAVSLEARVPILDHRVFELAWRLPLSMKHRDGETKWVLRRVLERRVPRALFDRAKMGFGVPVGEWLKGPLRDWAEDLLAARRLERFDAARVRGLWTEHLEGRRDRTHQLWDVLMFQAWAEHRRATAAARAPRPAVMLEPGR